MTVAALNTAHRSRRRDKFFSALIPLVAVILGNG
jgi:hypothetical protein